MIDRDDPLSAAIGIANGMALSVIFWVVLGTAYMVMK